jgi:hypothetical protein
MIGAEFPFRMGQRLFGNIRCHDVPTSQVELLYLPVERVRIIGVLCLCRAIARRNYEQRHRRRRAAQPSQDHRAQIPRTNEVKKQEQETDRAPRGTRDPSA